MRRSAFLSRLSCLLALMLSTGVADAQMRTVAIRNDGAKTIYRLYGWPSDLVPRTLNLLPVPLQPGDSKDLKVEDAYDSCIFDFQADFNNPRKGPRRVRLKTKYVALAFKDAIDLCAAGATVSFK